MGLINGLITILRTGAIWDESNTECTQVADTRTECPVIGTFHALSNQRQLAATINEQ